jgi:hypothetical protein
MEDSPKGTPLLDLSPEVLSLCICLLEFKDVVSMSHTCSLLRLICQEDAIWKFLFYKTFPNSISSGWESSYFRDSTLLWKRKFIERQRIKDNWTNFEFEITKFDHHKGHHITHPRLNFFQEESLAFSFNKIFWSADLPMGTLTSST